jgi:hypothetical protein
MADDEAHGGSGGVFAVVLHAARIALGAGLAGALTDRGQVALLYTDDRPNILLVTSPYPSMHQTNLEASRIPIIKRVVIRGAAVWPSTRGVRPGGGTAASRRSSP